MVSHIQKDGILHLNLDVMEAGLVGLKVTTPNMHRTVNQFIQQQKMLDLAVMGDLGLDQAGPRGTLESQERVLNWFTARSDSERNRERQLTVFAPKSLSSQVTKRLP